MNRGNRWCDAYASKFPLLRIKYGFQTIGSGTTPPSQDTHYYGGDIPWVTSSELRENRIESTKQTVSEAALQKFSSLKLYPRETVLFAMYGATIGRTAVLGIDATVNQAVCALSLPSCFDPAFAHYALMASRDYLVSESSGGSQPNLNVEKVREHRLPYPSFENQRRIVEFLNLQTTEIDELISAKERLLCLIEEKRSALVSHAVEDGLIASSKGKIRQMRLKHCIKGIEQGSSPQCHSHPADPRNWGVLKSGCVNGGQFSELQNKALPDEIEPEKKYEVHVGDILMSRASGSAHLIGSVAMVEKEPEARLLLSDKTFRIAVDEQIVMKDYFVLLMASSLVRSQIRLATSGASGLANNLPSGEIKEFNLPIPSIDAQRKTMRNLNAKFSHFSQLTKLTVASLDLLRERRSALIAAAVTGEITVGEYSQ